MRELEAMVHGRNQAKTQILTMKRAVREMERPASERDYDVVHAALLSPSFGTQTLTPEARRELLELIRTLSTYRVREGDLRRRLDTQVAPAFKAVREKIFDLAVRSYW
jgi:hypothetical protein